MINKHKKEIIIVLLSFLLYFILGTIFTYYLQTSKYWNVLFDLDTPRVFGDLALRDFNHYRATVHPLFILFFQPLVILLNLFITDSNISIILIQSIIASLSVLLAYKILNKIVNKKNIVNLLTFLFAISWGQIVFSSNIETYIYAQVFLILMWLFAAYKIDKKLNYYDYLILVLLGIGSLAITITNFIQYLIVLFFVVFCNKNESKRFLNCLIILSVVLSMSVTLATVQNMIWPTAPNFFTKNIVDFVHGSSEENLYLNFSLNLSKIKNVLLVAFCYSFNIYSLVKPGSGMYLTFKPSALVNVVSLILTIIFVISNIIFIYKTRKEIFKHKLYYGMLLALAFNLGFHLFYGNDLAFIYVCHFNFLIFFIIGYILNYFIKKENKIINYLIIIIALIGGILAIRGIYLMLSLLFPIYNPIDYFRIMPIFIILMVICILLFVIIKNKKLLILIYPIVIIISFGAWKIINKPTICTANCSLMEKYEYKLNLYKDQLKDMRNTFLVKNYVEKSEDEKIYFFGMADRPKILYKDGKLINVKTKEIMYSFDYDKELIVPNEYSVILAKDGKEILIYENEKGIYINEDGKIKIIYESKNKLNLPEFEDKTYSEILKVLHQEVLYNIDGEIPKPNIIAYNTPYYRDAMLAVKVLEETENTNLLVPWVNSITSIYDYARSKDLKEVDNLGELLYIIGATKVNRKDLINDIKEEIDKIQVNHQITGNIDGIIQTYFPTVLAINGFNKLGMTTDLIQPMEDDGYANLTWYHSTLIPSSRTVNDSYFPYLNWAYYHYTGYGSLYMLDELYPLTYEAADVNSDKKLENECFISEFYCEENIYISHMWHASEMFLYLINFGGNNS